MSGAETNLAELLLTAAEATPDSVCLEVEAGSFTFAQARGREGEILSLVRARKCNNATKPQVYSLFLPHIFFIP